MEYALVTGVSSGIGRAVAEKFLKEGMYVFGSVRKPEDAEFLKSQYSTTFYPLVFDVVDHIAVDVAFKEIERVVGEEGIKDKLDSGVYKKKAEELNVDYKPI